QTQVGALSVDLAFDDRRSPGAQRGGVAEARSSQRAITGAHGGGDGSEPGGLEQAVHDHSAQSGGDGAGVVPVDGIPVTGGGRVADEIVAGGGSRRRQFAADGSRLGAVF